MLTSESIMPDKPNDGTSSTLCYAIGRINKIDKSGSSVILYGEKANIVFFFMNEHVVRIKLFFDEIPDMRTTPAIVEDAVQEKPVQVEENEGFITITTDAIRMVVTSENFSLRVFNAQG